jgi:hypothetical protein
MMKPYLTLAEAAEYCGLAGPVFVEKAVDLGIYPFPFVDALLYRKEDIDAAMARAWRESINETTPGISTTSKTARGRAARSARLAKPKRRSSSLH